MLERVVGRLLNVDHWKEKEHEILSKKGRLQSLLRYMWKDESDLGKIMNPGASYVLSSTFSSGTGSTELCAK